MEKHDIPSDLIVYSIDEVLEIMRLSSKSNLYRLMKSGKFPEPIKIGGASRWRHTDLVRYLDGLSGSRGKRRK